MWIALLLGGCPQKEAREHLDAIEDVCPLAFGPDKEVELPMVAEDPVTLPYPQVSVHLDSETVRFDSWNSMDLDDPGFADELGRRWENGWTDTGVVMVAIAADTPGERVRDLFVHLAAMDGEPAIYGVAESSNWEPLPEAPHARYYDKAYGLWTIAPLEQQQTLWAMETTKLLRRCVPARRAFRAVAYASPEAKCELMVKGMQIGASLSGDERTQGRDRHPRPGRARLGAGGLADRVDRRRRAERPSGPDVGAAVRGLPRGAHHALAGAAGLRAVVRRPGWCCRS